MDEETRGGLDGQATERLLVALEGVTRALATAASAGGLSLSAASALGRLTREGPHRLTALAQAERVSQPAMTQLVTRLEREGLVRRGPLEGDGRAVVVAVTGAGRALVGRRRAERQRAVADVVGSLSGADAERLLAATPALERLAALAVATPTASPRPSETA